MELSWGKCTIKIGKLQSSGEAPSSWIDIPTPVENSTKLTPTKGAKKEAKIEGGENEAVKYAANTYTCLLYTSPSPRDGLLSRMPSSA